RLSRKDHGPALPVLREDAGHRAAHQSRAQRHEPQVALESEVGAGRRRRRHAPYARLHALHPERPRDEARVESESVRGPKFQALGSRSQARTWNLAHARLSPPPSERYTSG